MLWWHWQRQVLIFCSVIEIFLECARLTTHNKVLSRREMSVVFLFPFCQSMRLIACRFWFASLIAWWYWLFQFKLLSKMMPRIFIVFFVCTDVLFKFNLFDKILFLWKIHISVFSSLIFRPDCFIHFVTLMIFDLISASATSRFMLPAPR